MNSGGRGRGAGVRDQESGIRGQRSKVRDQRSEDGVSAIRNRSGMTLVEVLLGAAILAILAVLVVNALFYPRYLVFSSTLKQLAVQAGIGEIERMRADCTYNSMTNSTNNLTAKFNLNGRTIIATDKVLESTFVNAPGYTTPYRYKQITVTVSYGTTNVTLITYRSP